MKRFLSFIIVTTAMFCSMTMLAENNSKVRYNGNFEMSGAVLFSKPSHGTDASFTTCHGIELGGNAFFGLGTGVEYAVATGNAFIPIFADAEIKLTKDTRITPVLGVKVGGLFGLSSANAVEINPMIGVKLSNVMLRFGYIHLSSLSETPSTSVFEQLNGFTIGLSINIR